MPRNQLSRQPSNGAGQQLPDEGRGPEDREPERGDERFSSAHKLRDADAHNGYNEDREDHAEFRLPSREEADIDIDIDIMEVLDNDDLTQMDGPDA